jgi:hypothetical protein
MRNKVDLLVLGHILGCTFFLFFYSSIEQEAQTIQVLTKIFDMEHSTELPKCTFHNSWSGQYLIYLWKHIKEVQGKRKSRNDKGERCMPPLLACVCVLERERERERDPWFSSISIMQNSNRGHPSNITEEFPYIFRICLQKLSTLKL